MWYSDEPGNRQLLQFGVVVRADSEWNHGLAVRVDANAELIRNLTDCYLVGSGLDTVQADGGKGWHCKGEAPHTEYGFKNDHNQSRAIQATEVNAQCTHSPSMRSTEPGNLAKYRGEPGKPFLFRRGVLSTCIELIASDTSDILFV